MYSCGASQSDVKHAKSTLSQDHNHKQGSCDHIDPTCMLDDAMHVHIKDAASLRILRHVALCPTRQDAYSTTRLDPTAALSGLVAHRSKVCAAVA